LRKGFTLVELLIVITLVAVLAAIAIPRFSSSGKRSKETALRASLKVLRQGVNRFFAETGGFPVRLSKLDDTVSGSSNTKIMLPSGAWGTYSGSDIPGHSLMAKLGGKKCRRTLKRTAQPTQEPCSLQLIVSRTSPSDTSLNQVAVSCGAAQFETTAKAFLTVLTSVALRIA
jgi:prepilin-type N-terminal cleavage/methylation domain-containing protein